ncbi:GmrSD restriction endonuclease domain-containing protein [Candidatus Ferrigenium straubiae]|jgi:hypothetical protein|uniref:GmrSD restriction endonuclease domain-containing protein n=1 Tax=Candidatus Ferrigenium straubiae TaxID=2919506 RepID=UPI003F4AAA00
MAKTTSLVNLDAMIKREDFAATSEDNSSSFENVNTLSLREFTEGGLIGPNLRKPDFQRETNHWKPEQVCSLLECFVNGDLIPSVILWQSPTCLFVIDGGHRLSVLRAWIEDDYGDGPISQPFFGYQISEEQKRNAERTRELVKERVGTWQHFLAKQKTDSATADEKRKINVIASRGIPIQWVKGDADKAENSFFKINTKGTPLDSVEELLLRNRGKPISIASRAIIRAGKGHKYWSSFPPANVEKIEDISKKIHSAFFDPELKRPIKTLDLPLGGPKGVRVALETLIELNLIANRDQTNKPAKLEDTPDDADGSLTISILTNTHALAKRITGNEDGSLGLHPAVYFYGPTGRHSGPMFMGTMTVIARKLVSNDKSFFKKFSAVRAQLEGLLIENKDLIATILQKHISPRRTNSYASLLEQLVTTLNEGKVVGQTELVRMAGLEGKIIVGTEEVASKKFSDDVKSATFINTALASAVKCPICGGYLDSEKSISYDHITRVEDGGDGALNNCGLTHPYCNQAIKC